MSSKKVVLVTGIFLCIFVIVASKISASSFLTLPLEGDFQLGCGFAGRNCPTYPNHKGSDYPTSKEGHTVVATCDGTILVGEESGDTNVSNDPDIASPNNYGNYITIDHGKIDGKSVVTRYSHLLHGSFLVNNGDKVYRGQAIAQSGNSGTSTGPHLDFEVWIDGVAVDPYDTNNWLWTTNPPSHGYCDRTYADFDNHSSDGFQCGHNTFLCNQSSDPAETNTWAIEADRDDPWVLSSSFSKNLGIVSGDYILQFRAKVEGIYSPQYEAEMFLRDENKNWSCGIDLEEANGYFNPSEYNVYEADLAEAGENFQISQFRLDMTKKAAFCIWTYDWLNSYDNIFDKFLGLR